MWRAWRGGGEGGRGARGPLGLGMAAAADYRNARARPRPLLIVTCLQTQMISMNPRPAPINRAFQCQIDFRTGLSAMAAARQDLRGSAQRRGSRGLGGSAWGCRRAINMHWHGIKMKSGPVLLIRQRPIWLILPHLMFLGSVYVKPASGAIFRFASQVPHFQICLSGTPFSDLLLRCPGFGFASQVPCF